MGKLIYLMISSLDGFIEDEHGAFDWAAPGDEVHAFINELMRPVGTHLYGRRMYETMAAWETMSDPSPTMTDFAQMWRAADKVVYSKTLNGVETARTRIDREFDPDAVRQIKGQAAVGGAELAAQAISAGLVDEFHLFLAPISVGGGKPCLPRVKLELLDERRFADGMVYLHYRED